MGLLVRPAAANDNFVIALSLARAARPPALEELYFFGPHLGNFAFEIGNPDLEPERALGFDLALRARGARFEGEVSFFRNDIDNFIFRNPISDEEFAEREDEFDDRFNVEHGDEDRTTRTAANCRTSSSSVATPPVGLRGARRREVAPMDRRVHLRHGARHVLRDR